MPNQVHLPPVRVEQLVERDMHVLLWQVRGQSAVRIADADHRLVAGHAFWVPVGTPHAFLVEADSVLLPMFFPAASRPVPATPSEIPVDRDLRTLFLAFIQTLYTIIRPEVDLAGHVVAAIADRRSRPATVPTPVSEPAATVAGWLRADPGDSRSITQLAEAAHVSVRTIERAFRAETGTTLRQWRIRNRMAAAGELVRSRVALDAVAQRVGYTSTDAFRRVFKHHFGVPPGEYLALSRHDD